ncbi:MAG: hypothetical protein LBN28_04055 [Desulfovibrio sp.]|nr:hypothetical protein [Desulfovibrio sp.]
MEKVYLKKDFFRHIGSAVNSGKIWKVSLPQFFMQRIYCVINQKRPKSSQRRSAQNINCRSPKACDSESSGQYYAGFKQKALP